MNTDVGWGDTREGAGWFTPTEQPFPRKGVQGDAPHGCHEPGKSQRATQSRSLPAQRLEHPSPHAQQRFPGEA